MTGLISLSQYNNGEVIRVMIIYNTIQYNILLLQSQTDRCESDIHNDT